MNRVSVIQAYMARSRTSRTGTAIIILAVELGTGFPNSQLSSAASCQVTVAAHAHIKEMIIA